MLIKKKKAKAKLPDDFIPLNSKKAQLENVILLSQRGRRLMEVNSAARRRQVSSPSPWGDPSRGGSSSGSVRNPAPRPAPSRAPRAHRRARVRSGRDPPRPYLADPPRAPAARTWRRRPGRGRRRRAGRAPRGRAGRSRATAQLFPRSPGFWGQEARDGRGERSSCRRRRAAPQHGLLRLLLGRGRGEPPSCAGEPRAPLPVAAALGPGRGGAARRRPASRSRGGPDSCRSRGSPAPERPRSLGPGAEAAAPTLPEPEHPVGGRGGPRSWGGCFQTFV